MRNTILAAIGGLLTGHLLWLVAISLAMDTSQVNTWVLVIAGVTAVVGAAAIWLGRRRYRAGSTVFAAFLWGLPVTPVVFTLILLGVTYL